MSAKIKVAGLGFVICDEGVAKQIKKDLEAKNLPDIVMVNENLSVKKQHIQAVYIDQDPVVKNDVIDRSDAEYHEWRGMKHRQGPEERGKGLSMFGLLYWCFSGKKEIPEEIKAQAIERQTKFFTENPGRCFVDVGIFKDILDGVEDGRGAHFVSGGMRVIERCIAEDMWCARRGL
jgi:hypothetical protein